jgi:hypothetical protein
MANVVALEMSDAASVWTDLGFATDGGACQVGSVRIDLAGGDGEGIVSWTVSLCCRPVTRPATPPPAPAARLRAPTAGRS